MTQLLIRFVLTLALLLRQKAASTQELNPSAFDDLVESGRNGMVKFYQPWCSHCKRMKPDWDQLAEQAHPSVFIADVNCAVEESLCGDHHTGGQYPTILVYKRGTEELYTGGRGIEDLLKFVDKELAQRCSLANLDDTCSVKEKKYVEKWKEKGASAWKKEFARLTGMTTETLNYDLMKWLDERRRILEQLLFGFKADEL